MYTHFKKRKKNTINCNTQYILITTGEYKSCLTSGITRVSQSGCHQSRDTSYYSKLLLEHR